MDSTNSTDSKSADSKSGGILKVVSISDKELVELEIVKSQADDAAAFLLNFGAEEPLTPEEEKLCIRKTDWILLPVLFFTATMSAVDKVSLGTAAIYGLRTDLNLHGTQYSWLGSILFVGSLVGMWPMSYLCQRFPVGKVVAFSSCSWSLICLLQCACHNFAGVAALRFLMGVVESVTVPGCSLIMSVFYLKHESPHRTAIIFAFGSSIINGALSSLASTFGDAIPTWKYIYLLVGLVSFVWSLVMVWFLPDSPINAKFLSQREKVFMVKRMATNATGVSSNVWKWYQAKEAFLDVRSYLVLLFNFGINIPNGGLSTFSSIIINNLGFTSVQSSLMGMPTGVIASLSSIGFTFWGARWVNHRCLLAFISLIMPLIGAIVCYHSPHSNTAAQLVGLYFMYFYFASYAMLISCVQANTAGNTKKSVVYGLNYLGYAGGAILGSQTFKESQAPKYTGGFISMIVAYCACMLFVLAYWLVCFYMNKSKRLAAEVDYKDEKLKELLNVEGLEDEQIMDLTDYEQKRFFYTT